MILDDKKRFQNATISLNDRIELWQGDGKTVVDELGADKKVPLLKYKLWADVQMYRGREVNEHGKVYPYAYYVVTIRYREDITPDMYIKYRDKVFDINSIRNKYNDNLYLEIDCTERVMADGQI